MATDVEVRLVDVVKKFGDVVAVDHIDLEVRDGEFFSLLGPSGCGKTTTLRMIGGFEEPTSGLIELARPGRHLAAAVPAQRQHGLPELRPLPAPDDLRERRLRAAPQEGQGRRDQEPRRARCSRSSSCAGFEKRKPTQISGGQAQRVALARALINRPAVLLLDEPLGALDLKLRKQMQLELKRIQQEVGITFIYVTHDQEEAMTMSDRIAVMNRGPLRAAGRPGDALRAAGDAVRGRLPRRLEPAARHGRRAGRRRYAAVRLADDAVVRVPVGAVGGSARRRGRRPAREDPAARRRRRAARRASTSSPGTVRDASYLGVSTQYVVETRGGGRAHGLRAERRAHDPRRRSTGRARTSGSPGRPTTRSPSPRPRRGEPADEA